MVDNQISGSRTSFSESDNRITDGSNENNVFEYFDRLTAENNGELCAFLKDIPVGYMFKPTDEELIYYLYRKTLDDPLPSVVLHDIDATEFFGSYPALGRNMAIGGEKKWYFCVKHEDNSVNLTREGCDDQQQWYWEKIGDRVLIRNRDDIVVGYKSILRFNPEIPIMEETRWTMEEFELSPKVATNIKVKNSKWTLARLVPAEDLAMEEVESS